MEVWKDIHQIRTRLKIKATNKATADEAMPSWSFPAFAVGNVVWAEVLVTADASISVLTVWFLVGTVISETV